MRILATVIMALLMAPDLAVQEPPDGTRRLDIDLVAVDDRGTPVTDLKAQDLEVWIAGYRAPIESLLAVAPGDSAAQRTVVLLLDDMVVPLQLVPIVRRVARRFVTGMSPGDQMAIVSLSGDAMALTSDPAPLLRRIDAYNVRPTTVMRRDDLGAQVLQTVAAISRSIAEAPGRHKTIVAIGSGWLFDRPMPPPSVGRDLQKDWVDTMRALAFSKASVYVIDTGGVGTSMATGGTSGFARETGGHAFMNTNDFEGVPDRILREANSYYVVRVTDPPSHRKAPLREVDVRSPRRGITVRARRGIPGAQ